MTENLKLARNLELPVDAVTQTFAFLGRRGSGKTYGATKLAELMLDVDAQIVALDPVGVWYGLRLNAAQTGPSPYAIPVLGGRHGDIPLEATAGKLIADLVVDRGTSIVLDVSMFESDAEKARFAEAFAARFFFRKKERPSAVHVFVEECQEFIPQNPQKGDEKMLHAFNRMMKLGRNFGIGMSLISQRPQEVNKKTLNMSECLLAFQMTGPQERKTIEGWAVDRGVDEDAESLSERLPFLEVGTAHVWSPQWLGVAQDSHILKKRTADVSSTPKVGAAVVEAKPLGAIDLEQLQQSMAATIEKAKLEDPVALRSEISRLNAQVKRLTTQAPAPADPNMIAKAIESARAAWTREFAKAGAKHVKTLRALADGSRQTARYLRDISGAMEKEASDFLLPIADFLAASEAPPAPAQFVVARTPQPQPTRREPRPRVEQPETALGKGERVVLTAVAQYPVGTDRERLTVLTGYKRSSRDTYLQRLQAAGYVEQQGGSLVATDAGLDALGSDFEPLPVGAELRDYWLDRLSGGEREILEALIDAYPDALPRDVLGEAAGYKRSSRDTYLQRLGARKLVENVGRGEVRASEKLFEDTL